MGKKKYSASKSNNHSNSTLNVPMIAERIFEHDREPFSLRQKPISDAYVEDIASKLVTWVRETPNAITINSFLEKHGIAVRSLKRWAERNEALQVAYEFALQVMGGRRDIGATYNQHNVSWTRYVINNYGDEWKANDAYHAQLRQPTLQQPTQITVQLLPIENTGIPEAPNHDVNATISTEDASQV